MRGAIAKNFVWLAFLAANALGVETNVFHCQTISLPVTAADNWLFADMNTAGRCDLLAVDPVEKKLLIYRQHAFGFTNAPDQVLCLPAQTAWLSPYPVEANHGMELLMSTVAGLVYYRQTNGAFESEPHTLIQASQCFLTNNDAPTLITLATNAAIPVLSATQAVLYQRDSTLSWRDGQPVALEAKQASWHLDRNEWTVGANSSHSLQIRQSFRPNTKDDDDEKPENDTIKKLLAELKKAGPYHQPSTCRVDLDGDGQKDLVLWQALGDIEPRTDIYVYLRGADGRLPERPTQYMHCRGFPIPIGSTRNPSAVADLKGDGSYQLVLVEVSSVVMSANGVVEMALSRGVDLELTIRTFHQRAFSRSPDAAIPLKSMLSLEGFKQWPLFVCGDFNGDGRADFMVQRSPTQWNIFSSTADGHWFAPQPTMSFETPLPGSLKIKDLNGDGRSDIIVQAWDEPSLSIFMMQPQTKGKQR